MKVGDYVRTKDGIIDKIIIDYNGHCADPKCNCKHVNCVYNYYDEDTIVKSSPNIIDLIEVGDVIKLEYDGNEYICDVYEYKSKAKCLVVYCEETIIPVKTTDESIELKSVVTKEQFSQMEYRIGE